MLGMAKVSKNGVSGSANKPDEPEDSVTDSFFYYFLPMMLQRTYILKWSSQTKSPTHLQFICLLKEEMPA